MDQEDGCDDSSMDQQQFGNDDLSVDLSDIKSENDSVYWEQQRGTVENVDILINNEKLFDHEFLTSFKDGL